MSGDIKANRYGGKALLPIFVFLGLYVGCGVVFAIMGTPKPFNIMPRYVAVLAGVLTALFCFDRKETISQKADIYYASAGGIGVMTLTLIILLAGGFAGACAAVGGKSSLVNLGASMIPPRFVVPGVFIMCAIVSTCIGTSVGTASVMGPVAAALAEGAGVQPGIMAAAVVTGSYFGDNLSMISDTTICATKGVGAQMKDKFRMNFALALPAAIVSIILYAINGAGSSTVQNLAAGDYNLLTIIPYVTVLVLAVAGIDVIAVLSIGMGLAGIIGIATGSGTFFGWAQGISSGMESMFWLSIFVMMLCGMVGLIRYYGGLDWVIGKAKNAIKTRRSCEKFIGLFTLILCLIIANNTLTIIISAPVANELGSKYKIAPKRLASLLDIGACLGTMIVPHGTCILMVQEVLKCDYLDIMKYDYYALFLFIATAAMIQFGLMRTKEEKKLIAEEQANAC